MRPGHAGAGRAAPGARPQGAGDGNCGAGVVDGACGAVGHVAWVGIETLSVPIPTHIGCVATPVSRKAFSGHQRCRERAIADTQRPERPFAASAMSRTRLRDKGPGAARQAREAGLPHEAGFACRAKQISTRTKIPNRTTTAPRQNDRPTTRLERERRPRIIGGSGLSHFAPCLDRWSMVAR